MTQVTFIRLPIEGHFRRGKMDMSGNRQSSDTVRDRYRCGHVHPVHRGSDKVAVDARIAAARFCNFGWRLEHARARDTLETWFLVYMGVFVLDDEMNLVEHKVYTDGRT